MKNVFILFLLLTYPLLAQQKYFAVGTPVEPKVKVSWDKYRSTSEIEKILKELQQAYPDWCKLESLGKSYGKKDLWLMTITSPDKDHSEKPAFWIDGGIHANELQGVEASLYTAWYLLEMKDENEFLKQLLTERTFYILPTMSPDSRDAHLTEANTTHSPRTGQIPVDDDLDGLTDEDGFDDINKDGSISLMRKKDPHGKWKVDPANAAAMIRVEEGESGEYTILGMEGIDNDNDGLVNEDGDGSYDPNRNWAWNWQPEQFQRGAHNYPFSIPEVRVTAQAIMKRRNIAGSQTYHNTGGMFLIGPGKKGDTYESGDMQIFTKLANTGEKIIPGYKLKVVNKDLYSVHGGELDWFYKMRGVFCFNNELFTPYNFFHKKPSGFMAKTSEMQEFDKYLLFHQGSIKWQEFDHPQYGKIEIGGFTKNWMRQPPGFMIQEECHRNMAFTIYHASQMPLVKITGTQIKELKEGLFELTVTLKNNKLCPTHTIHDIKNKINPPNFLTVNGEGFKVLTSFTSDDFLFRHLQEQKRNPEKVKINNIGSYGTKYVRFLIEGKGEAFINFISERAGKDSLKIDILKQKN
ncbi:MAG: M14 family metallopeptidase [Lentisphaeraceae bacterium]|nr:M14 family metallopeptidase [Lentisphaeraceae bacterium]